MPWWERVIRWVERVDRRFSVWLEKKSDYRSDEDPVVAVILIMAIALLGLALFSFGRF